MTGQDDAEFERFAAMHLPTILHVATLLSSDEHDAEVVTLAALRQVQQRGTSSEGRWQRHVYAALIRGYRRRRSPEQTHGTLELQDFRPAPATASVATPSSDSLIRDGLRALSDTERTVLVLRLVAALDLDQIPSVVRRPGRLVRRDLSTAVAFLVDVSGTPPDQAEVRIAEALKAPAFPPPESAETLVKLHTVLAAGTEPRRRLRPVLISGAALITAAVAIIAFTVGQSNDPDTDDDATTDPPSADPTPTAPPELPTAISGLKLVGYEQIMVAVPEDWTQYDGVSSGDTIAFARFDSIRPDGLTLSSQRHSLGGEPLLLSKVQRVEGGFLQYGALADANVAIQVRAKNRTDLAIVLSSIQEVPASYVVVPDCVGLDSEEASDLLTAAGLNGRVFADPSSAAAGLVLRVATQTPAVGSVLPFDATVNLGAVPR